MKTKLHYLLIALLFSIGIKAQTISITGTGTGDWTQPGTVVLTSTDGENYTATNFQIKGDGEMKFSEGDWGKTYGVATGTLFADQFPSGVAATIGSQANIKGQLGWWNVTYNIVTKAYSFTAGVNPFAVIKINGGGLASDLEVPTANGIAYNRNSTVFPGGDAKFIEVGTANEFGGAFPDGPVASGTLIPVPTGVFNVYFFKTDPAEYLFEPTVVSMIGNFVGSAWNTDLDMETTDNINYTMNNWTPVLVDGWADTELHLKFRDNHGWAVQFGGPSDTNGGNSLATTGTSKNGVNGGGGDIFIPWGTYNVNFNRFTGEWTFADALGTKGFASSNFKVYPNPTTNNWNFVSNTNSQINSVRVVDVLGKVVVSKSGNTNAISVDATNLSKGVYFAKVTTLISTETIKLVRN